MAERLDNFKRRDPDSYCFLLLVQSLLCVFSRSGEVVFDLAGRKELVVGVERHRSGRRRRSGQRSQIDVFEEP